MLGTKPFSFGRLIFKNFSLSRTYSSSTSTPSIKISLIERIYAVKADIDAKSVAIFQDANPEAAVIVFEMHEGSILNYDIKMKMGASGTITAIVEGKDGKFYVGKKTLEVALGGCEG